MLVGLILRLIVAVTSERIHHPDEVFQYLEQAHRLTYGYGFIPWEYRFGIRSWIVPGLLTGLLQVFARLGLNEPQLYIPAIKAVLCVLSLSLIYGAYFITKRLAESETAGQLAAIFIAIWYEFIYFASKPTPEVLGAYCLVIATTFLVSKSKTAWTYGIFGLMCGLALIIRYQYLPAIACLGFLALWQWGKSSWSALSLILLGMLAFAGIVDYFTWGTFGISYYNNFLYNSVYGVSKLFGTMSPQFYAETLFATSAGLYALILLLSFFPSRLRKTGLPLLMIGSVVLAHTAIAHKEYRFIFASLPFLWILAAMLLAEFMESTRLSPLVKSKILPLTCIAIVIAVSIVGINKKLPGQGVAAYPFEFRSLLGKDDILSAYLFLSQEPELTAFVDFFSSWVSGGGYYYLHRDIPNYQALYFDDIAPEDYSRYVSHILCRTGDPAIPNFSVIAQFDDVEIRKVIEPPSRYEVLDVDVFNPGQLGVDDKFTPAVPSFGPQLSDQRTH